jgi:diacylglycerol kinase
VAHCRSDAIRRDMHRRRDRPLIHRMKDGLRGIREGWKRDQAMRTHVVLSLAGIVVLIALRPPLAWTLAVAVLLVAGLAAELVNSTLEAALDKLHPDLDPTIGAAKEMASAAAAVINLAAVAIFLGAILAAFI